MYYLNCSARFTLYRLPTGLPTVKFRLKQTRSAAQLVPTPPPFGHLPTMWMHICQSKRQNAPPSPPAPSTAMGGARRQVTTRAVALCIGHHPPAALPPPPLLHFCPSRAERDVGEAGSASRPTQFDLFTLCLATGSPARTTRERRAREVRPTRAREP